MHINRFAPVEMVEVKVGTVNIEKPPVLDFTMTEAPPTPNRSDHALRAETSVTGNLILSFAVFLMARLVEAI